MGGEKGEVGELVLKIGGAGETPPVGKPRVPVIMAKIPQSENIITKPMRPHITNFLPSFFSDSAFAPRIKYLYTPQRKVMNAKAITTAKSGPLIISIMELAYPCKYEGSIPAALACHGTLILITKDRNRAH